MTKTETTLRKLYGKPFYSWKQGLYDTWSRILVGSSSSKLLGVIEDNKYTSLATYYFGRHPANRMEFSRG